MLKARVPLVSIPKLVSLSSYLITELAVPPFPFVRKLINESLLLPSLSLSATMLSEAVPPDATSSVAAGSAVLIPTKPPSYTKSF